MKEADQLIPKGVVCYSLFLSSRLPKMEESRLLEQLHFPREA